MSKPSIKRSQQRTKHKKHWFPCDTVEVSTGTVGKFCNQSFKNNGDKTIEVIDSCTVKDWTFIKNNNSVLLNADEVY